jgi:chromosome segregation ATPase
MTDKISDTANARLSQRNTKAEILAAYEELKKEKSSLQSQFNKLSSPKNQNSLENSEAVVLKNGSASKQSKMQQTIDGLTLLQSSFGNAISELSEQLTQEATLLESLQKAVEFELQQLNELHSLESVEDETLEALILQYEESAKNFEAELTERQETLEQQLQEQQKAWKKEQEDYQRQRQERNENYKRNLKRDRETYHYNLQLQREREIDEYEQNKNQLDQQLEETRQTKEQEWKQREEEISLKETEYAAVKEKVEAFPDQLEDTLKKAKESGRNIGYYQAKIKVDLLAKEMEGQKRFYELRIQSLSETINTQETRLKSLSQQLDAAQKQVQDLAVKAIEGTSNLHSFQAVKEILLEQAKNQPKGK